MALVSLPFCVLENWGLKKCHCVQKLKYLLFFKVLNDDLLMTETHQLIIFTC